MVSEICIIVTIGNGLLFRWTDYEEVEMARRKTRPSDGYVREEETVDINRVVELEMRLHGPDIYRRAYDDAFARKKRGEPEDGGGDPSGVQPAAKHVGST